MREIHPETVELLKSEIVRLSRLREDDASRIEQLEAELAALRRPGEGC